MDGPGAGRERAPRQRQRKVPAKRGVRLTRRGRVLAWSAGVLAVLVLSLAGVGAWVYQDLNGNIGAADIDDKLGGGRPVNLSPGSKNIMIVGSDSRAGANAGYGKDLTTMQSDTLLVLHIPADREWASVVSFPRDSWVRIPACDKGDGTRSKVHHFKINEAFALGGTSGEVSGAAACSIRTVEENTGLRIDHFMSVDFQGFKGMVDALDGIEVCPKEPIDSPKANLKLAAGCQTIKGEQSLGYVRARYGVGDNSDIGRIGRQQEFMDALAKKAQSKLTSPDAMYGFLQAATDSLTTDRDLAGIKPLYGLASELKGIPSDRLSFLTVPNYPREADVPTDKANVVWQYPQAADLFTALANDKETTKAQLAAAVSNVVHASAVHVRVLNGTGEQGRAAGVAEKLREAGYTVDGTGNQEPSVAKTQILYPQGGDETGARALAARLGTGIRPTPSGGTTAGTVTLVVGPDLKADGIR